MSVIDQREPEVAEVGPIGLIGRAVAAALTGAPDPGLRFALEDRQWLVLANANRLGSLALAGLRLSLPGEHFQPFAASERSAKTLVFVSNTSVLRAARQLAPLFDKREIEWAVIKGPLAQKLAYDTFFVKPATDIDILVAPRDYSKAAHALAENGYMLANECASPWWRFFLGEQHFQPTGAGLPPVDLHCRLQQPGSPAPALVREFLTGIVRVEVGAMTIPTPDRGHACLISCMQLAKALQHREPAGGYAADIAALLPRLSAGERAQLAESAKRQGLAGTLRLGCEAARVCFGVGGAMDPQGRLARMIMAPAQPGLAWRSRTRMLWELSDRPHAFVREAAWKALSDVCAAWPAPRPRQTPPR